MSAPDQIGPLRIERELGAGGMGEVYLARDPRLERHVAVKLLPATRSLDPDARGRMLREARAASALNHPGIVTVYDVGDHDGRAYIVMEYVDGETFERLVARRGRLPAAEAVALFAQVADAVAAAHDAGVLHRDLKSANLMVAADGRVKVLDFGLSKRTDGPVSGVRPPERITAPPVDTDAATVAPGPTEDDAIAPTITPEPGSGSGSARTDEPQTIHGARMGTPGWAPPELIDGRPASVRSDVFALGCVLYHLLTGELPFGARGFTATRAQIEAGATPPSRRVPDLPPALDAIVLAALAEEAARRPESARAMLAAVQAAVTPRATSRRGPIFAAAGIAALGVVAVVVIFARGKRGDPEAAARVVEPPPIDAMPAGPPQPARLTRLKGCAYNPAFLDDATVVFDLTRDHAVDLWKLRLDGSEPVRITQDEGWEWRSSRGATPSEVLFIHQTEVGGTVQRRDLDTGVESILVETAGPAVWANGAYYHAPTTSAGLHRLRNDRDEVILELPPARNLDTLVPSPAGDRLAAMLHTPGAEAELCLISLAVPSMSCLDDAVEPARPAWSSRGDALYVQTSAGLARRAVAAGPAELVFPGARPDGGIAVSPSGRTLVYSDCGSRDELVDALGDLTTPIVEDGAAWAPALGDDGALAYVHDAGGAQVLMIHDVLGTTRELVRREGAKLSALTFAPGSARLAYVLGHPDEPGIYSVLSTAGPSPNRLTEDPNDDGPVFIGDEIVFSRKDRHGVPRLMRMAVEGGTPVVASKRPRLTVDVDHANHRVLLSSPDRAYLYWWDPATGAETPGPPTPQEDRAVDLSLSPNGRWLLILHGANGQVVFRADLRAATPALERVVALPEDLTTVGGAIDDRGRPILSLRSWTGELWWTGAPPGAPW